jgi:hypothetical protein
MGDFFRWGLQTCKLSSVVFAVVDTCLTDGKSAFCLREGGGVVDLWVKRERTGEREWG